MKLLSFDREEQENKEIKSALDQFKAQPPSRVVPSSTIEVEFIAELGPLAKRACPLL